MDMFDKIVTGVAIVLVQKFMPDLPDPIDVSILYFKWILSFGLGGTFIFSIILWVLLMPQKVGRRYSVYVTAKNLNIKYYNETDIVLKNRFDSSTFPLGTCLEILITHI